MSTPKIAVAVLGTGRVADLVAKRIEARPDLTLAAASASTDEPPALTDVVVYLPTSTELATGAAGKRVAALLRAGFDVVSTAPLAALRDADLLGACREGASTFHGTGGFQSSLVTRVSRAFASITRGIRDVELIEELDVEDPPAHPWASSADVGLDHDDPQALTARTAEVGGYYDAGLRALSEAVFGDERADEGIESSAMRARRDEGPGGRPGKEEAPEQVVVRRTLGARVAYDSVWTRRQGSTAPLRYRLDTTTADAVGHATITFHAEGEVRPADHLTCAGLLDAIRHVHESAPGVLHHDLDIHHVKPDDRLSR